MSEPMTAERLARLHAVANAEPKINGTTSLPMVITDEGADPWLLVPVEFLKEAMSEVSRLDAENERLRAALTKIERLRSIVVRLRKGEADSISDAECDAALAAAREMEGQSDG